MILYHRTDREAAAAILAEGFRDGPGSYLTDRMFRGVWLTDHRHLDATLPAIGETLIEVKLDVPDPQLEN
jgi:hypothetical protein